jgi:predicted hotdog family 3-hydroxylacyl-ACP dehydratase
MNIQPKEISVLDVLPQRPPFIMIDELTHVDATSGKTMFTVREDNLFCKDGVMEETGLIENIAQTCAARINFKHRFDSALEVEGNVAKIGILVLIHSLEIKRRPLVGEVLETLLTIEEEFFSTTVVQSEVRIGNETVATCRMKLLLTDKTPDKA